MNPFDYNDKPTEEMVTSMNYFRARFKEIAESALRLPDSRERNLCLTKLEEASMWVNKAIAHKK